MKKSTFRFSFSDNSICELEATSELNAKIQVFNHRKSYGGIPYRGMIKAQRPHIVSNRGVYITKVEKIDYPPNYCKLCNTVMSTVYDTTQKCPICSECKFPVTL